MIKNRWFSWPGAKYRQMEQILEHIDISSCNTICEPFLGTAAFSLQFAHENKQFIWAEKNKNLYYWWRNLINDPHSLIKTMSSYKDKYKEAGQDKAIFNTMRAEYNRLFATQPDSIDASALLWVLVYQSINNLARFNKKGEYNQSWGQNRKVPDPHEIFNKDSLQDLMHLKDNVFLYQEAGDAISEVGMANDPVVYFDPPYILRTEVYDKDWDVKKERRMFNWISILEENNIPWFMTNYLVIQKENGNTEHPFMEEIKNWTLIPLDRKLDSRPTGSSEKAEEYVIVGTNKTILKG